MKFGDLKDGDTFRYDGKDWTKTGKFGAKKKNGTIEFFSPGVEVEKA